MKAIKLIALVITIVILIILVGVLINITIGDNGLINKTKTAKENYEKAVNEENEKIQELYSKLFLANTEGTTLENIDMKTLKELIREEGNPTGTIIAFYGETAPKGYLPCDGTPRNTSDYSELAEFLGATGETFNLPDLRGEFLRGAGTNSHTNSITGVAEGSGEEVRGHQDATTHLGLYYNKNNTAMQINLRDSLSESQGPDNKDSECGRAAWIQAANSTGSTITSTNSEYTSRPTNTSVLYCIKY